MRLHISTMTESPLYVWDKKRYCQTCLLLTPWQIANASVSALYEDALVYEPGTAMTSTGALTAYSGAKTGRSPLDKRVVKEPGSDKDVWWGPVNKPMSPEVSFSSSSLSFQKPIMHIPRGFSVRSLGPCNHRDLGLTGGKLFTCPPWGVTPPASPVHYCPSAEAGSRKFPRSPLCRDVLATGAKTKTPQWLGAEAR
jgi:hypothetical protein